MGRKGRYETHVEPHLEEIREWITIMTEEQIAKRLGISVSTFEKYKREHEALANTLLYGRQDFITDLRSALKKKAMGFTQTEVKRITKDIDGKEVTVIEETDKVYPPDTGAAHLLLKNMDSKWHNDDETVIKLRERQQALAEKKHEDSQW